MKLTEDGDMLHCNAWCTHRELTDGPKKSCSKIYSLLLVLIDKMKQDADWGTVSDSFDPITLFKLIGKFVLKQLDNQCKTEDLITSQFCNFAKMIK
jgi:hypothetical protein